MGNLESWFDYQSKRLDGIENNYGKCLVTGQKKTPTTLTKKQAWSKIFKRNEEIKDSLKKLEGEL